MDLAILLACATALLAIIITLIFLQKKNQSKDETKQPQQRGVPQRAQEGVPRRAQIVRNQRNRLRQNAAPAAAALDNAQQQQQNDSDEDPDQGEIPQGQVLGEKMGAKKRAKMEAKEQKRILREQEMKQREDRKAKEAKQELERKEQEEREAEQERKQAEAEHLVREEQKRKEHEEYLKMIAEFSVEEEGFDEDDEEKENLFADFIKYIKDNKVVVLEDLAMEFKLKTHQAIERILELQASDTITGVIDDRGKFIYISEEELQSVAKFIRQRGRVSITELAECSNNLINLTPVSAN